jgi:hypothetical protein
LVWNVDCGFDLLNSLRSALDREVGIDLDHFFLNCIIFDFDWRIRYGARITILHPRRRHVDVCLVVGLLQFDLTRLERYIDGHRVLMTWKRAEGGLSVYVEELVLLL